MAANRTPRTLWRENSLTQIVDKLAREEPSPTYGIWPVDQTSYLAGVRTITYTDLGNIVNGLAWWLMKSLDPDKRRGVLAYYGPNDVRFTAMVLATMKTGHGVSTHSRYFPFTKPSLQYISFSCPRHEIVRMPTEGYLTHSNVRLSLQETLQMHPRKQFLRQSSPANSLLSRVSTSSSRRHIRRIRWRSHSMSSAQRYSW